MEIQKSIRYRIKVEVSTKGVQTWDNTIETEGCTIEEALMESDKLVQQLRQRYPIKVEGK